MVYFSTILSSRFGIKDKNQAPDKPTGPAPTTKIDFLVIFLILSTIIINFDENKIKFKNNPIEKIIIGKILPKENKNLFNQKIKIKISLRRVAKRRLKKIGKKKTKNFM